MPSSKFIGNCAEQIAKEYLQKQHLKIITANYTSRYGEIDLIALHNKQLVFIEVRYRRNQNYGGAISSIGYTKQRRLIMAAQCFLQQYPPHRNREMRFDVIAISDNLEKKNCQIEWLQDAFQV